MKSLLKNLGLILVIAGAIILYTQNASMFGIAFIIVVLYGIIVVTFNKQFKKLNEKQMEDNAQLTSYLVESLNGIQTVKAYNAERKANLETEKKFVKLLFTTLPSAKKILFQSSGINARISFLTCLPNFSFCTKI